MSGFEVFFATAILLFVAFRIVPLVKSDAEDYKKWCEDNNL